MPDEKNHLFGPLDMLRDSKAVNKRKSQQQFSRFSVALATSVTNATIQTNSPALQPNSKPQIGLPYDDTKGSVAVDQTVSFDVFGSQYTFVEVTSDVAFTFIGLPTGRFIEFILDISVNQVAGVTLTFPQVTNPPVLTGDDGERSVLKFAGVRRSDPTGVNPPVDTYTFLAGTTGTTGGGCPIICKENNLGEVLGAVDLDWSKANFHRAVLIGDTTFNIINTPGNELWQDICLEVQQNNVGGYAVDFLQGFANSFIPMAITGAGRYTSFQIYTYEEPGGVDIFHGFDKTGGTGPSVPGGGGLFQGFAGYIQTILSSDQTTNIGINAHIEFDVILENDTLIVSPGSGQSKGIFSGFRPGHTYSCEVYIAGQGSANQLNWAAKWFDRLDNGFIGTQAVQRAGAAVNDLDSQQVGKAFFRSTSLGDSLEVRITNATNLSEILNGSASTEPQTFAIIKDCGIVEEVLNAPEPAPEFGELDVRDMMYSRVTTESNAVRFDSRLQIRQTFSDVNPSVGVSPLIRNIRMKGLMVQVTTKGAGDRIFNLTANGVDIGPVFTLPSNTTGFIDFGAFDVLLEKDKSIGWKSSGGQSGDDWQMTMIVWFL